MFDLFFLWFFHLTWITHFHRKVLTAKENKNEFLNALDGLCLRFARFIPIREFCNFFLHNLLMCVIWHTCFFFVSFYVIVSYVVLCCVVRSFLCCSGHCYSSFKFKLSTFFSIQFFFYSLSFSTFFCVYFFSSFWMKDLFRQHREKIKKEWKINVCV